MLQRRQHKAQRRRVQNASHDVVNTSSSNARTNTEERHVLYLVVAVSALFTTIVTLSSNNDGGDSTSTGFVSDMSAIVKSVQWLALNYPSRFYAFYAPKIARVWRWIADACDAIEIPDDIAAAIDFTAALVATAPAFHIIGSARQSFVASLRSAEDTSNRDVQPSKKNADEGVCGVF